MDIKAAKEVIQAGFAFGNWDDRQKEAFKIAWECMTNESESEDLLIDIRQRYQVNLFTAENNWCIQLFDSDVHTNSNSTNCVYEDQTESLKKLLVYAYEWVLRNNEIS
ncbi:hypothetical protein [Bacillus amyloliquefaciens]|uniref:hypothetical protein n=1 Tax=Bacillus amyloliquefaciens TaxID=1390 RepID=UPI000E265FEB|nr:hypothetical protein [Bacillus amyloliquefaciens]RDY83140.1 hypothetical protein C3733_19975 [Bacillus amyloliquefaciens]